MLLVPKLNFDEDITFVFLFEFSPNSCHPKSGAAAAALKVVQPHKLKRSLNYKGGCGCHNYRINEICGCFWCEDDHFTSMRECG
jgi:hypothetical protein